VAAVSLLPYWGPLSRARDWDLLVRGVPVTSAQMLELLGSHLVEALGTTADWHFWVWMALFIAGAALAWNSLFNKRAPEEERSQVLFATVMLFSSLAGVLCFLFVLHYPTPPWYYLGLMALMAVCLDIIFGSVRNASWLQLARAGVAILIAAASLPSEWRQLVLRQTNVDLIAANLNQAAGPNDLVVVAPWTYGISFHRYFHGAAPWVTVPNIEDHRFHRFDLVKPFLMLPDQNEPIQPVVERIGETLKAGHRVWVVGEAHLPPPGVQLPSVSAAPDPVWGWLEDPYDISWLSKVAMYLHASSRQTEEIRLNQNQPSSFRESPPLTVFWGYGP
jgi:hypothetical protein